MLNNVVKWQFIVLLKPYTGCVKKFYCMIYTIKLCNKTIHNVRSKKQFCLCPNNILYQRYNLSFVDDLSITWYNKFHQIWDSSFRGNVSGHNPYETFVVIAWIWYAKDLSPLYVMSLPSSLCFKVKTSLWLGHFLVNMMSHISKMSSGWIWKKEQCLSSGYLCLRIV